MRIMCPLPIRGVERDILRDLRLPAIAVREQLFLIVEKLFAGLGGEFEIPSVGPHFRMIREL